MGKSIKGALHDLDPARDDDWTEGGLPSLSRMKELTGNRELTRAEVSEAEPGYTRDGGPKEKPGKTEMPDPVHPVEGVPDENQPAGPGQHPGDRPLEDQGPGNPNDATLNAERRDPEAIASGHVTGLRDDAEYVSREGTDPVAVAEGNDPIMLLEAVAAAAGSGRYARNSALQTIVRAYQVSQREIKEVQARLDQRFDRREQLAKEGAKESA